MESKDRIINKFSNEVDSLEKHLEHRVLYNYRNLIIRLLIKSGIVLDYAFPFILSALVILYFKMDGNLPFYIDDITEYALVEVVDTSNGIHMENVSFDRYTYDRIDYSTGWVINDFLLYEKVVTSYRIDDKVDLSSVDKVLALSKEKLDEMLVTTNIKTIYKNILDDKDRIYDEDSLSVVRYFRSDDEVVQREETLGENVLNSAAFTLMVLLLGISLGVVKEIFVKTYFRDKLNKCESLFNVISKDDLEEVSGILGIKRENLLMLEEQIEDRIDDNYSYKLKRK